MSARSFASSLKPRTPKAAGVMVMVFLLGFALLAFNRPKVETTLASGENLQAEFSASYKLVPYQSVVKLAGVEVGTVTGVERSEGDRAVVEMKLHDGTRDKLGTAPSANVRPTLVLGGTYYVELVPGGEEGDVREGSTIPVKRTTVPVELDRVLSAVTPDASDAVKGTVKNLDRTMNRAGDRELRRLLTNGPGTLEPASEVLSHLRGTVPATDLTRVVDGLRNTSAALNSESGQLDSILTDLGTVSSALADSRTPLAETLDNGPETMRVTRAGLADLDSTLDKLGTTAKSFRPAARELDPVLAELDTVLETARPVIADARVVVRDARPLVKDLVPTSIDATGVLNDFKGPVLNRLNGPVKKAVNSSWKGKGLYEGGGNDNLLYEEVGYLLSDTADVFKFHDKNGAMGRLMAGVGVNTPGGVISKSLIQYLESAGFLLPAGPEEGANEGEPKPPLGTSPPSADPILPKAGLDSLQLPLVSRSTR
ncbi:MlaD family protein [Nocardioides sp. Root140]|uniref:MlaD family protein n=1 Tax=Nocardioides sp. Root140 TaxID=1736460 RepID=UPI0006FD26AB|nr:MlaD family protein [Nocardioides sp. Root140]KQY57226.1 aromatic ring-opening dioxygenase LigA [Nocardioides sp. Root140]